MTRWARIDDERVTRKVKRRYQPSREGNRTCIGCRGVLPFSAFGGLWRHGKSASHYYYRSRCRACACLVDRKAKTKRVSRARNRDPHLTTAQRSVAEYDQARRGHRSFCFRCERSTRKTPGGKLRARCRWCGMESRDIWLAHIEARQILEKHGWTMGRMSSLRVVEARLAAVWEGKLRGDDLGPWRSEETTAAGALSSGPLFISQVPPKTSGKAPNFEGWWLLPEG